jgi:beta-lactamase regulating signal transducer with metallopeptidase domain
LVAWAAGALVVLGVLAFRHQRLHRALAEQDRAVAVDDPIRRRTLRQLRACARALRLRRAPRLVMVTTLSTPAILGVFRPVVVMPVALARELSPAAMHHVLLHELAHVRRGDLWLQALGSLLQAVYWFYPLLPWVRRRIAALCELCCDATVAERLRHRTDDYRRTLAECALRLSALPAPALQLSLVAAPIGLFARLHHLEEQPWRTAARRRWSAALTVCIATACVLSQAAPPPAPLSPVMAAFHQLQRELALENLQAAAAGQWRSCLRLQASALLVFGSGHPGANEMSPPDDSEEPKEAQ